MLTTRFSRRQAEYQKLIYFNEDDFYLDHFLSPNARTDARTQIHVNNVDWRNNKVEFFSVVFSKDHVNYIAEYFCNFGMNFQLSFNLLLFVLHGKDVFLTFERSHADFLARIHILDFNGI